MHVFGTETHMTAIVGMALGKTEIPRTSVCDSNDAASKMFFNTYDVRLYFIPLSLISVVKESYVQGNPDVENEKDYTELYRIEVNKGTLKKIFPNHHYGQFEKAIAIMFVFL